MEKLTNTIGSFIIAIAIIAFPVIVGIGIAGDWLEADGGTPIHPFFVLLWIVSVGCTIIEVAVLTIMINESE